MSGLEWGAARGERVRFLTLTSSPQSTKPIHESFRRFVKRVRRKYGTFEYLAVREYTKSGLAHLHVLFRGAYLPQGWVSTVWEEIHQARITYLEEVKGNLLQVASYLAKYVVSGEGERFWWSWGWVYRGFVADWKRVVRAHVREGEPFDREGAVRDWRHLLWKAALGGRQTILK